LTERNRKRLSILLADENHHRRRTVKRWILDKPTGIPGPFAEASSGDVAYSILRDQDQFAAELGLCLAKLPSPPHLILYAHDLRRRGIVSRDTPGYFQQNAAFAHTFIDLRCPNAPARLKEALDHHGNPLLFLQS
jgi:hypothetical protein